MFPSTHNALSWAYRVSDTPIVHLSSINRMCCKPSPETRNELLQGLSPKERHTQAALIIFMVEKLDDPACVEYIQAKFSGRKDSHAVRLIMHRALSSLGTGVHRRRGVYKILLCHMGENVNQRSIRHDLACSFDKMMVIKKSVFDSLDRVHEKAMYIMTDKLQEKGLVET